MRALTYRRPDMPHFSIGWSEAAELDLGIAKALIEELPELARKFHGGRR